MSEYLHKTGDLHIYVIIIVGGELEYTLYANVCMSKKGLRTPTANNIMRTTLHTTDKLDGCCCAFFHFTPLTLHYLRIRPGSSRSSASAAHTFSYMNKKQTSHHHN